MRAWRNGEDEAAAEALVTATPPKAVVLCLDSPGGVVAGLQETAKAIRRAADEAAIPIYAYINEMATSAAYALACSCDELYLPASGIAGSIGVISTMADQSAADAKAGIRVVTLTSGARKADGHPHVPISDEAIDVEQERVDALARQFFRHVSARRGLSVPKIASYEAGIFLGRGAVDVGLVDAVMGWDAFVEAIDGKATDRIAPPKESKAKAAPSARNSMLKLRELVANTKKAIKAEKNAKKRKELEAKLGAYQLALADSSPAAAAKPAAKTTHTNEHKERHVADDGDEDDVDDGSEAEDDDEEEGEDEEEEASGNETDRGDDEEEDEEEEEASSYSEEEEASTPPALRALVSGVKDKKLRAQLEGQLAALVGKAAQLDSLGNRVAKIEKNAKDREKSTLIARASSQHRITPRHARQLANKPLAFVKSFLAMHAKPLVNTNPDELAHPDEDGGDGEEQASAKTRTQSLGADLDRIVDKAISASNGKITREQFLADYERERKQSGGKAGRY